ncbi:hypothetical protein RJ640_023533 [Escallonia rubra]|uniref:CCT domain-containing protein n=1 Tax=Escallonia rubra TaxID=112253 RepID=A0AA88RQ53_9ASTE|nr:hypothetical protein RJ640_023533 [Escallonia rubra]
MAAVPVNPRPLQARPYEHHLQAAAAAAAIQIDDDGDGDYEDGFDDEDDGVDEVMDGGGRGPVASASNRCASGNDHHGRGGVVASRTSELTLAFEGEVQAVLLLLGGSEIPTGVPTVDVRFDLSNKVVDDTPKRSNLSRRIASLVRFREKRKERCFDKKIRYSVRKEVAQRLLLFNFIIIASQNQADNMITVVFMVRKVVIFLLRQPSVGDIVASPIHAVHICFRMHRKNGQFASVKEGSGSSSWDSGKGCPQGDGTPRAEAV